MKQSVLIASLSLLPAVAAAHPGHDGIPAGSLAWALVLGLPAVAAVIVVGKLIRAKRRADDG